MQIYNIKQAVRDVVEQAVYSDELGGYINESTGEIIDRAYFEQYGVTPEDMVEGIGCIYKESVAFVGAIKAERDEMYKRQKREEARAEWLKKLLTNALGEGEKFKSPQLQVSWRKSTATELQDGVRFPDAYYKVELSVDKKKIGEAHKAGEIIEGAALVEHNNIQIK